MIKLHYFLINNLEALDSLFKIEMFNRLVIIHIFFIFYDINKSMKAGSVPNHILNKISLHTNKHFKCFTGFLISLKESLGSNLDNGHLVDDDVGGCCLVSKEKKK